MHTRKRILISICLCLGLLNGSAAANDLNKAIRDSTVWISYDSAGPAVSVNRGQQSAGRTSAHSHAVFGGTGFLLFQDIGLSRGQIYLITNKHVLPPPGKPQDIKVRIVLHEQDGNRVDAITVPIVGADGKYLKTVRLHPDAGTDVAAVDISAIVFAARAQILIDAITAHKCLDVSMLMTAERLRNSEAGMASPVYLVGFPAALFDARNVSPLVRIGYIATDPREGYDFNDAVRSRLQLPRHLSGFLVDASVYPGSSGSLVVLVPDTTKGQDVNSESTPQIMGIVGGSIPMYDDKTGSYERIGLGIVYSSDAIREVLKSFVR